MSKPNSQLISLGDCVEIISGFAFDASLFNSSTGLPLVRIRDVSRGRTETFYSGEFEQKYLLSDGDLLIGMDGEFNLGVWSGGKALLNQRVCKINADESRLDQSYLKHFLPIELKKIEAVTSFATVKHLSVKTIREISIPLPELAAQRRIAAILDEADELRAKRRRSIALLNELQTAQFEHRTSEGAAKNFIRVPLPEAFWFQEGPGVRKWQFTDSGVKLLNVGNILKTGELDLTTTTKHVSDIEAQGKYSHFLVDEGDYVMASSGISFDADGLLRTRGAFVRPEHMPLCMNTSTIRFKAIPGRATPQYLHNWIQSTEFRTQISKLVTGSAQQNFGPSHLRQLHITLPPMSIQEQIESESNAIREARRLFTESLTLLDEMFASLQDRAFKGEL